MGNWSSADPKISPKREMEDPRQYRQRVRSQDLVTFRVTVKETDLLVSAERDLQQEATSAVWKYRHLLEWYIAKDPGFKDSLAPYRVDPMAPQIVKEMAEAAAKVGVGPMAAVAGAISECVGRELSSISPQIILENGGDIFLMTRMERIASIFTESPLLPSFIDFRIRPEKTPLGIGTSSGKEGPSLSLGRADAVMVVSPSAALADAAATAAGNLVRSKKDIRKALDFLRGIPRVTGGAVLVDGEIGLWGDLELAEARDSRKARRS